MPRKPSPFVLLRHRRLSRYVACAALAFTLLLGGSGPTVWAEERVPPAESKQPVSSRRATAAQVRFIEAARQPEAGTGKLPLSAADAGNEKFAHNRFRPLGEIDLDVGLPDEKLPPDYAAQFFASAGMAPQLPGTSRPWATSLESWQATALCHRPLYFEEVNLERYGKSLGVVQPVASAANMFGRVLALPYLIGATPPRECVYTLGQGRPGSYMPLYLHRPPVSIRGGLLQATAVTGTVFIVP